MELVDRIGDFLRRLTPLARSNLLIELERLEVCDSEIPGSAAVLEKLRAEFRAGGQAAGRSPKRHYPGRDHSGRNLAGPGGSRASAFMI